MSSHDHARDSVADTCGCTDGGAPVRDAGWHRTARPARLLSWVSLVYLAAEGVIAITAAILAGSVALLGFGLRRHSQRDHHLAFTGTRTVSETAETRAQKAVAVTFFLLPPASPTTRFASSSPVSIPIPAGWAGCRSPASSSCRYSDRQETPRHPPRLRRHQRRGHPE